LLALSGPRALIGLAAAMAGIAAGCALLAPRANRAPLVATGT